MNVDRLLWIGVVVVTICRLLIASHSEVSPKEALVWMEVNRPATGYLFHGGAVPFLIRMSSHIFGDTALGLRWWNPLMALGSTYFLYLLARSATHPATARWCVVVLSMIPAMNLVGVYSPFDSAGVCAFLATVWFFWCALHRSALFHALWLVAGLMLGITCLISWRYGVLLSLCLLVCLIGIRRWHGQWLRPGIYLLILTAGVVIGPLVQWHRHTWGEERLYLIAVQQELNSLGLHPLPLLYWLFKLTLVLSPIVVVGLFWAGKQLLPLWKEGPRFRLLFLLAFAVPPIVLALLEVLFLGGDPMSYLPGTCFALVLLVYFWMQSDLPVGVKQRWRQIALVVATVLTLILSNTDFVRTMGVPWAYRYDLTADHQGWKESARSLETSIKQAASSLREEIFVIAPDPETAAVFDYYLSDSLPIIKPSSDHPQVNVPETPSIESDYQLWPGYESRSKWGAQFLGKTALWIEPGNQAGRPPRIRHAFESTEPAAVVRITRRGRPIREWTIFNCYGYKGIPL